MCVAPQRYWVVGFPFSSKATMSNGQGAGQGVGSAPWRTGSGDKVSQAPAGAPVGNAEAGGARCTQHKTSKDIVTTVSCMADGLSNVVSGSHQILYTARTWET